MEYKILHSDLDKTTIIIRFVVGAVFLSEGIQKFLFPELRGAGRFETIGLPFPEFFGNLVGAFEIICGLFILLGFITRLAAIPLIIIMGVAIASTKTDIYLEKGFWETLHVSRTDWAMLLGSLFLLIKGSGAFALDSLLIKYGKQSQS